MSLTIQDVIDSDLVGRVGSSTVLGVDIGSRAAKAVLLHDGHVFVAQVATGVNMQTTANELIEELFADAQVKLDDIDWMEAADNYVCLHAGRETHVVRQTMSELESQLDPARFLRVHRSAIVNLDRIRELQPWFRGDYRIILRDGTELTLTKNHREKMEAQLLLGA